MNFKKNRILVDSDSSSISTNLPFSKILVDLSETLLSLIVGGGVSKVGLAPSFVSKIFTTTKKKPLNQIFYKHL